MTYTITRPVMGRDELATHRVATHGRAHGLADDGFDDMALGEKAGWRSRYNWGRDGYDLGETPYVNIQTREADDKFYVQQIVEGDHDVYSFDTEADQHAAIDYLFLWYAAGKGWSPWTHEDREAIDRGGFEVTDDWRGPYRES